MSKNNTPVLNADKRMCLLGNIYMETAGPSFGGCVWNRLGIAPTLKTTAGATQQCVIIKEQKGN